MSTTTTNLGLKKPAANDFYNIQDFNDNADLIDEAVAGKADAAHTHPDVFAKLDVSVTDGIDSQGIHLDFKNGDATLLQKVLIGLQAPLQATEESAGNIQSFGLSLGELCNDDTIEAAEKAGILSGGGLTLLNSILQLYLENAVVEEYDDEGWHIKKYANGYAECFGRVNVGQVTLGTQLGTDVVSNVIRIAFPITFEELPEYCSVTYEGNGTGYATLQSPGVSQLSTTHAYSVRLCRIGAQSTVLANNIFNVHVLGKYQ